MIREVRDVIAHHLAGSPWPIHRYLPDDVAEVPCIAVPRPRLTPSDATSSLVDASVGVLVVGGRLNDHDGQAELDDVTDLVISRFGGITKGVRPEHPLVQRLVVDDVLPTTVTVAGLMYPAYALTVTATLALC